MRRLTKDDRLGLWLLLGCALFLGLGAATAGVIRVREPRRDPSTLCVVGRPVSGETIVLIDCTDPLTADQVQAVSNRLRQIEATELSANARVSLWVLGESDEGQLRRLFCRCHPGRQANPIIQNPRFVAAACESLFATPLGDALRRAPMGGSAARSPILEALCTLSRTELVAAEPPRRLILISDLLQNSRALSFYSMTPGFEGFRSAPRFKRLLPDLGGVEVEVLRIPRTGEDLEAELPLLAFWEALFEAAGARTVRIGRLT